MAADRDEGLEAEYRRFADRMRVVTAEDVRMLDRTVCEEFRRTFPAAAPNAVHTLTAVPPGWSRLFFRDFGDVGELRVDGSSSSSGADELESFPARMFGGIRFDFFRPIAFDEPVTKTTYLDSAEWKNTRSGPLVIAVDRSDLVQRGELCEIMWETSIYKPLGERRASAAASDGSSIESATGGSAQQARSLSALEIFRYAAITRNSHRLHYDLAWARDVEGYADLLVPGPLVALLMLGAAERLGLLSSFSVRMRRSLLCNAEFTIDVTAPDSLLQSAAPSASNPMRVVTARAAGHVVAEATAVVG